MRIMMVLMAFCMVFAAPCRADDAEAAQAIVRAQEQAIVHDDPATAYSYASPLIQQMYPSPEIFMGMVRDAFAPVYRHKTFEFGPLLTINGKLEQTVNIIDIDGQAWQAVYTLEVQSDGSMKISACALKKAATAV